jgi:hypothetical protein
MKIAFDQVDRMLQSAGFRFAFELTSSLDHGVLILSPEGDEAIAGLIDQLLMMRPHIPQWQFFGRRQRKPLPDAVIFVQKMYGRSIQDARFLITRMGEKLDVTMFSASMDGLTDEERDGLAATFLDHAVGEDRVMSKIRLIKGSSPIHVGPHLLTKEEAVDALSNS